MMKYRKKVLLTEVGEPFFIRHKATETHNEVTVVVVTYALPLGNILPHGFMEMNPVMFRAAFKAANGFQDINLEFNKNSQSPAFLFKVKAKTERRGDDAYDQAFADKIVMSKAKAKACIIAQRIVDNISKYLTDTAEALAPVSHVFEHYADREAAYFRKMTGPHK
jgi:hypothetical protein